MKNSGCFGVGSALLVLVFSVLCLTVSALMTLSSANGERALSEKLASSVLSYYSADCTAVETAVLLSKTILSDEVPSEINGVAIKAEGSGVYSYFCSVDENRSIFVKLREDGGASEILSWQVIYMKEWTPDEKLTVWTGEALP